MLVTPLVTPGCTDVAGCPNAISALYLLLLVQDEVLIAGFGRRGHAVGDIPGVRFKVSRLSSDNPSIVLSKHTPPAALALTPC